MREEVYTKAQHSPTPWTLVQQGMNVYQLVDADGEHVAYLPVSRNVDESPDQEAEANAAAIVRMSRSHAALVEALEGFCFSASMRYGVSDGNDQEAYEDAEKRHGPALASRYLIARRALAAAKVTK